MNHMTDVGVKGIDLYVWEKGKWNYLNSGRPEEKTTSKKLISNMTPTDKEFMIYLPLYDGLVSLQIGIDSLASINQPNLNYPQTKNPIIFYGTSITQGGCATRPGMSYTNILSRHLNREIINLGFSGNGRLDYEIAETIGQRTDASLIILDFVPNVTTKEIQEKTATFVQKLRQHNEKTPILFIESIIYTFSLLDSKEDQNINTKNKALKAEYDKLRKLGFKNLHYISNKNLIGHDGEGTVDGIHFTDVGFIRFANTIYPKVKKIIR